MAGNAGGVAISNSQTRVTAWKAVAAAERLSQSWKDFTHALHRPG